MERWFLTIAAAATAAAALASCGGAERPAPQPAPAAVRAQPAETVNMPCSAGFTYPSDDRYFKGDWRRHAIVAGPITVLFVRGHSDGDFSRRRGLHTKVALAPHGTTTLAVAPEDRDRVSLSPHIFNSASEVAAEGKAAITFEGCEPRTDDSREGERLDTGYAFTLIVESPGCATFEITPEGGETIRRRTRFGVSDCA